jgi:small subunit ribosomal protein S20
MAHHKSAQKRIRQTAVRRLRNRYRLSTLRAAVKKLRSTTAKDDGVKQLPVVVSKIDLCVKHNIFHKNRASRMKSSLSTFVNKLG